MRPGSRRAWVRVVEGCRNRGIRCLICTDCTRCIIKRTCREQSGYALALLRSRAKLMGSHCVRLSDPHTYRVGLYIAARPMPSTLKDRRSLSPSRRAARSVPSLLPSAPRQTLACPRRVLTPPRSSCKPMPRSFRPVRSTSARARPPVSRWLVAELCFSGVVSA